MQVMSDNSDLKFVIGKYGDAVYNVICSRISRRAEADDIYQEVFLLYYTKELDFPDEAARRSWLIRTALNMTRSANRSSWNIFRDDGELDAETIPDDVRTPQEQSLWNAVRGLRDKYRLPVILHYFNGVPVAEAANMMGIGENTFKSRLMRARKLLKTELENLL
ncbi:MAG: sigma-70 family RNA polymerase sigma factor [Ruminococcus sp.]|nr:sigma-70 family RNA polymerase sigma factor [Ruminococcus sp.]